MRILHTSDWHIGRTFHGNSTMDALADVLSALVRQVAELSASENPVDVVIIAGDVFDSATPAGPAYTLLGNTLVALHETGARVIVTSGNHDSAARLGFQAQLLRDGIHVMTDPLAIGRPVTIDDADGPVHFYGIPYLEPAIVRQHWPEVTLRTQAQTMAHAMGLVRADLASRAGRSVAIAHCFAAGVEATDGLEREVRQGGLDVVPLNVFDGPDYVALGHIHGRQTLSERVRYAGAPLHYSFGEQHKERGSWLVDIDRVGAVSAQWLALPVPRRLVTLTGALDEILSAENVAAHADDWVCAVYTDTLPQAEPMRRLKERFPYCAMVQHAPVGAAETEERSYSDRLKTAVTDTERIEAFLEHVRAGHGASERESELIDEILDERVAAEALV
ncbi:exonuclease SbcCD subunit D [Microbacterium sp. A94]|uniref:exonuclease SbcCD subunit D n=1 Tax=Microbacterium sp. A94 TaxID=3450717 RepID=UPI003F43882A